MKYKSFEDLHKDIRRNIYKVHKEQYDLVIGLPRSGMIPAYTIALYLNINCVDLHSFIYNIPLKSGITRKEKSNLKYPHNAEKILLVDDSISSGKSLKNDLNLIPKKFHNRITTLAIYSSTKIRDDVDIYFEYLPGTRIFEWNIFHQEYLLSRSCFDIDGVLCKDPKPGLENNEKEYREYLLNAIPLFIPTSKINTIITNRLSKYRNETEKWLEKYGIEYNKLLMIDLPSANERNKINSHIIHKANYYKKSDDILFVESSAYQASGICDATNKPVYCVDNNIMYLPGPSVKLKNNPLSIKTYIEIIKDIIRPKYYKYVSHKKYKKG